MRDKSRATVHSTVPLVGLNNSKRLLAIRQSVEPVSHQEASVRSQVVDKKERDIYLAREAIRLKIAEIKSTYPLAMQNKLFAIRYSSEEKMNQMALQQLFTLLNIKQKIAKEIAQLRYLEK